MTFQRILATSSWLAGCCAATAAAQVPLRSFQGLDYGVAPYGEFGACVAGIGDVDRDGHDDLAVGAPNDEVGGVATGRAYILSGRDGALLYTFDGVGFDSDLGSALAGAGDVDQDGWLDILVGAPGDDLAGTNSGTARLYSGKNGALLRVWSGMGPAESYGYAVAGAGDVNGDHHPDLAIGAPALQSTTATSYLEVRSGRDGTLLYRITSASSFWKLGVSVCGAGDQNGDGLDDVVVGERRHDIGAVHAFIGATGSVQKSVFGALDFGATVRRFGDSNGDGVAEILVAVRGAGNSIPNFQEVVVWDPVTNLLAVKAQSTHAYNWAMSVAAPGDVSGDGVPDLVIGSPWEGTAYLRSGSDGSLLWPIVNLGDASCDLFGTSVAAAGDVDADGQPDVVVGAPDDSPLDPCAYTRYGSVLVFTLAPPTAKSYCTAKTNSLGCIPSISSTGHPSALIGPDDFMVVATNVISNKSGLLLWSQKPAATPFQGGILCLAVPLHRTPVQSSGPPPPDCSGRFQYHFRQVVLWKNLLFAGSEVFAQYAYRDPASTAGTGLTDGLQWIVGY